MIEKPYMTIEMPDGSVWAMPAQLIAKSYADYYEKHDKDYSRQQHYDTAMEDDYILKDWAANNMHWKDLRHNAIELKRPGPTDFEEGLCNGDKEIVR